MSANRKKVNFTKPFCNHLKKCKLWLRDTMNKRFVGRVMLVFVANWLQRGVNKWFINYYIINSSLRTLLMSHAAFAAFNIIISNTFPQPWHAMCNGLLLRIQSDFKRIRAVLSQNQQRSRIFSRCPYITIYFSIIVLHALNGIRSKQKLNWMNSHRVRSIFI